MNWNANSYNRSLSLPKPMSQPRQALLLCALMLLMSVSPLLSTGMAEDGGTAEGTPYDSGWVALDLTGADGNGTLATADFHSLVPYGIQLTGLSFEVRVDGAAGLFLDDPRIWSPATGEMLLDTAGLGRVTDFTSADPHNGRMAPRSDASATWTLPGNATITDIIFEALRPVDPLVSLAPYTLDVRASAVHPDDGRLYLAISGGSILMLDSTASPTIIDRIEGADFVDLHMTDSALFALDDASGLHCWNLDDGDVCTAPASPSSAAKLAGDGTNLWAADAGVLYRHDGSGWTAVVSSETDDMWTAEPVTTMMVLDGEVLVGTDGGGVARWDIATATRLGSWSTANHLPSDEVTHIAADDRLLVIGTKDDGMARQDRASGNWLAHWHEGNWLRGSEITGLAIHGDTLAILSTEGLDVYDIAASGFTGTAAMDTMGLADDGHDLILWPSGGVRAPSATALLVSDGSGAMAVLDAAAAPQAIGSLLLATTPLNDEVWEVLELDGILFAAGDEGIDRFDIQNRRWLTPIDTEANHLATDGARLLSVGESAELSVWNLNGTLEAELGIGMAAMPTDLAWDPLSGSALMTLGEEGLASIALATEEVDIWNENDDFQTGWAFEVVARDGVAYVAVENEGVARVNLITGELLSSWRSSGVDDVDYAPLAVDADHLYLGLHGAGVFVFDKVTGELLEVWSADEEWWWGEDGDIGTMMTLQSNWVRTLHVDEDGDVYVGGDTGFARRDGGDWDYPNGNDGDFWWGSSAIDIESDDDSLWVLHDWQGLCEYRRSNLQMRECWNQNPRSEVVIDVSDGNSLRVPQPGRLFVTTDHGAYLIDTENETILDEWVAGGSSWNAPVIVWDDIAHLAVDGVGIARYDLLSNTWMSTLNEASGALPGNGVTALVDDVDADHLWAAGDFGLVEIDLTTGNEMRHWDTNPGGDEPRVSRWAAQTLVRIGDVIHLLETPPERRDVPDIIIDGIGNLDGSGANGGDTGTEGRQRPGGGGDQPTTRVHRFDVVAGERLSNIDPTARFANGLSIIGMEAIDDVLWIGVGVSFSWWWENQDRGGFARWNATDESWESDIEPDASSGSEATVSLIGECTDQEVSTDPTGCRVFVSYGDDQHRLISMMGEVLVEWDENDIEGPVNGVTMWGDDALIATPDGVARIDTTTWNLRDPWTAGDGLPAAANDNIRAIETVDDDLWVSTRGSSSSSVEQIHRLDGAEDEWMTWSSTAVDEIPSGYGVTIEVCADIVHVGFRGEIWIDQGGIARYDLNEDEWLDPFVSDWGFEGDPGRQIEPAIEWGSYNALACDDDDVLYAGIDQSWYGIQRYDYGEGAWMDPLTTDEHGISEWGTADDAMVWSDGFLIAGHPTSTNFNYAEGALSLISASGDLVGGGQVIDEGIATTSVALWPQNGAMAADFIVAQPGVGGPGRAQLLSYNGDSELIFHAVAGLQDGRARHFAANATHVYAAMLSSASDRTDGASMIVEGTFDADGEWETTRTWSLAHAGVERMELQGGALYVTTRDAGLYKIFLDAGAVMAMPPAAHDSLSWIVPYNGDFVIGMSAADTAAGVSVFDPGSQTFLSSELLPGLPSPQVRDITQVGDVVWFATAGGLGSWDLSQEDWGASISAADGLASSDVHALEYAGGELWVANHGGLCAVNPTTHVVNQCMSRNQGLIGSSTIDLEVDGGLLYASHDGFGPTRPGATQVRGADRTALLQFHADSIPSNDVRALAADGWGVHIATDEEPLSHWNAATGQMENGIIAADIGAWPIHDLSSDGTTLMAASPGMLHRISVSGLGHPVRNSTMVPGIYDVAQGSLGTWVAAGENGVYPFGPAPGWEVLPQVIDRRATPLRATFGEQTWDITSDARPGAAISLAMPAEGITTAAGESDALTLSEVPLILSSDVDGAAVWARTTDVRYAGTWDLAASDAGLRSILGAVAFGATNDTGHDLHLRFDSPANGSIQVRLSYIGVASDSPVQMLMLEDRPDDGGDALIATWTPTMESGFVAYVLNWTQGANSGSVQVPDRFNVQTTLTGLVPDVGATVTVAVQYSNGESSNTSAPLGPVIPVDDVPLAPAWGEATFDAGMLDIEWAPCTALDHAGTKVRVSTTPLDNLTDVAGALNGGNSAQVEVSGSAPLWIYLVCVDAAGQFDGENPLEIGPISLATGVDDEPPEPVEWVLAEDNPGDGGGALRITWAASEADDCVMYAILTAPVIDAWPPASAAEGETVHWVTGCETTEHVLTGLADGVPLWVSVVPYDAHLNADLENAPWDQGVPMNDLRDAEPPARVLVVDAVDVPADDGGSVQVTFSPSSADDVASYTVWVSAHDVSDVTELWARCSFYLDTCAQMVVPGDAAGATFELTLSRALYGETLLRAARGNIVPDVELFVAVTAHDTYGNVYLDDLVTAQVTPVNDNLDVEAPPRLAAPTLSDVPDDDGRALLLDFVSSEADDVAWYAVYVEAAAFADSCELQPAMLLPTDVDRPVIIDRDASGHRLEPGHAMTVAVVPVDDSANAICTDLATALGTPLDNREPPSTDPVVTNIAGEWKENGTELHITWTRAEHAGEDGFSIFVSPSRFAVSGDAIMVARGEAGESFVLSSNWDGIVFDSSEPLWVAVVMDHERGAIIEVEPVEVAAFKVDSTSDTTDMSSILLIGGLATIVLILAGLVAFAFFRRPPNMGSGAPLMGVDQAGYVGQSMNQEDLWSNPVEAAPEVSELPSMTAQKKEDGVDTSFLDDLL